MIQFLLFERYTFNESVSITLRFHPFPSRTR